jgi:CspA family cold shock protein
MSSTDEVVQEARLVGQVKWFNNKAGYGFITVSDGDHSGKDIFVHFTTVRVANSQYKYLIQGEYVEFSLTKSTSGTHEYQATDVSGIKGGALMCETRRNNRMSEGEESAKPQRRYRVPTDDSRPPRTPRAPRPTRAEGEADGQGEFTEVRRRPTPKPQAKSAPRVKKEVA